MYVAGPYSQGDVVRNVARAIVVGNYLMGRGYRVYVPHTSHFQHLLEPRSYWDWLEHGIGWMLECDAMVVLPGPSRGVSIEVQVAQGFGIPVFPTVKDFEAAFPVKVVERPPNAGEELEADSE